MKRRLIVAAASTLAGLAFNAAAAPNSAAVEFYNTTLDHYFVTSDASEALGIDSGAAGPGWQRTGRSFPVWTAKSAAPADAQPVCRFYSAGANSHFYTASASECAGLKAMQANAHAATGAFNGWGYEGVAFYVQVPSAAGACPAGTTGLTRAYNNGFATGAGSNHRFMDDGSLAQLMADQSWVVEGTAMCAQSKSSTGGVAPLAQTTANFDALAGTWEGTAAFKSETATDETKTLGALSLTVDATGAITGTGGGCTFAGQLTVGDGFRAHFRGSITATGCTDSTFDGTYDRVHFERLGAWGVNLHMKREDGGTEAMIFGLLDNNANTPPPTLTAIAGTWVGTVAWKAETGDESTEVKDNQDLSLTIADTGDVTGTGFGCTITGTVAPKLGMGRHGLMTTMFVGDLTAAGCTEAAFNGTFSHATLRLDADQLDVRLTREDADGTEVQVAGDLTPSTP